MKVGIAGTGKMGTAIAERLIRQGHVIVVWNRTPGRTSGLAALGTEVAATPRALAEASDVIITILTDAAAIDAVYRGTQGLLEGDVGGKLFIEMSTVRPETEEALAPRVRERGAVMVDCPVGGTTGPAREGRLFGFVGGSAEDVARARPLIEKLCRRVEHVGPVGAGARMKLAINLPLMVYWQALGEALALCAPLKLDPARLMDIFADTSGGPNVLKVRGPAIAAALKGEAVEPVTFDLESMSKDLRSMIEEARALGAETPAATSVLASFDEAVAEGLGGADSAMLPARWVRRRARP